MKTAQVLLFWATSLVLMTGCGGGSGSGDSDEIIISGRMNSSGTYSYFQERVLGKNLDYSTNISDQASSKAVVEFVASTPNAIGYSGMGAATDEVRMLPVSDSGEAVEPTLENAVANTYPLARPLYLYTLGEPEGALKHYIEWIMSAEGQKIVMEAGYIPLAEDKMVTPTGSPGSDPVEIQVAGSDTMSEVAGLWSEAYNKLYNNVRISVSGGGSGTGIASLIDDSIGIANASREMKEEERTLASESNNGKEVIEFIVGQDALAVYVHKDNPLPSISIADLKEIYGEDGSITRWSQVAGWPKAEDGE